MKTSLLKQQAGASILEILISILILSIAVLALGGLQAKSISAASDAKYRVEATTYADQIMGTMWADRANLATYPTFAAPAAAAWRTQVMAALPGATAPTIVVTPVSLLVPGVAAPLNGNLVSVTVRWAPPGLPTGAPAHQVTVQSRIDNP
jgi:type IV pilus assembly protein PilV